MSVKEHKFHSLEDFKKIVAGAKIEPESKPNDNYVPPEKRPCWCVKENEEFIPQFRCLAGDDENCKERCPFFGYAEYKGEDENGDKEE